MSFLFITLSLLAILPVQSRAAEPSTAGRIFQSGFEAAENRPLNPTLVDLPANRWVAIHTPEEADWRRQNHAGTVFDTRRGLLYIFGSDTHRLNWNNSVMAFDPVNLRWERQLPESAQESYRANAAGIAVAGPVDDPRPWAMHTYDALVYDPVLDALVVMSGPFHNSLRNAFGDIILGSTWIYDLDTRRWRVLDNDNGGESPTSFIGSAAYDSNRNTLIQFQKRTLHELGPERRRWLEVDMRHPSGLNQSSVFDPPRNTLWVFGDAREPVEILAYTPGPAPGEAGEWRALTPTGATLPADRHYPVAYDQHQELILLVVDEPGDAGEALTFIYDPASNRLTRLPASGQGKLNMHYMMEYDPFHRVFLLVAKLQQGPPTVLALKLDPAAL